MDTVVTEKNLSAKVDHSPQAAAAWPSDCCYSLPQLRLDAGREAWLRYFENTWALTETLFSALIDADAFYRRPYHELRHPLIFYYAHPVTFYINKLQVAGLLGAPVNSHFEVLFETGVDEMRWDDLHPGNPSIWPTIEEVQQYRRQVYEVVRTLILTHPVLDDPVTMASPAWALAMCFEHERIHLETSSVLIRELPEHLLRAPQAWPPIPDHHEYTVPSRFLEPEAGLHYPAENKMLPVPEQKVTIGKPHDWPTFGWDNEYGEDEITVPAFQASSMLISNGEYYEFVRSAAYLNDRYWSAEGWQWRQFRNARWPTFWVQDGPVGSHRYKLRTLFEVGAMRWDWPVIVNYYEASAYCAWRSEQDGIKESYRLLRESEHLALRDGKGSFNYQLQSGSEGSVQGWMPNGKGFYDVEGNIWQWSEDVFAPLKGFEIHPYYIDFSVPCFDGKHHMILGSSFISTGDEASLWSRFHFRPHFFQHAGFRLAMGGERANFENKYETDAVLSQYLLFHYGSVEEQRDEQLARTVAFPDTENFIVRIAELTDRFAKHKHAVLDLGCAVGRASFELSRAFRRVIGLDFSDAFITAAKQMQTHGCMDYTRQECGRFSTPLQAHLPADVACDRVNFMQGDACHLDVAMLESLLPVGAVGFDAVVLSNLLCRLPDPARCLGQFTGRDSLLAPGGILLIASPNSWMQAYTQADRFLDAGGSEEALQRLAAELPGFELLHAEELPFMIREHRRKYEYIISQVSIWRKTG